MDAAVSQQRYAQAEQYRVKLTELQEEKTLAIEKEASKDPSGKVGHHDEHSFSACSSTVSNGRDPLPRLMTARSPIR